MGKQWKQWQILFWGAPKSLQMVTTPMKLKDACSWKKSYEKPRQCIKKQRHYFADKGPSSQSYGFSSSHLWLWEVDHKEGWAPKNWCFWTVAGEDFREFLGLQGDQNSQSKGKSTLNIHWKDWCWSWNSNTLATWCIGADLLEKTLIFEKTEGRRRGQQKMRWWMASPTWRT